MLPASLLACSEETKLNDNKQRKNKIELFKMEQKHTKSKPKQLTLKTVSLCVHSTVYILYCCSIQYNTLQF